MTKQRYLNLRTMAVVILLSLGAAALSGCKSRGGAHPSNPISGALAAKEFPKALQLATARNDAIGKFYLGRMYESGWGVPKDPGKAFEYYQQATDGGFVRAKVFLADMYFTGAVKDRDPKKSAQLYKEAADQGDVQGQYLSLPHFLDPSAKESPEETRHEIELLRRAADAGDPMAGLLVGSAYGDGVSMEAGKPGAKDQKLAARYLLASANSNTQLPGSLAANELLKRALVLDGDTEEIKQVYFRYIDSGDVLMLHNYLLMCVKYHRDTPTCETSHVMKYGDAKRVGTGSRTAIESIDASYLSTVTQAQRDSGAKDAAEWKVNDTLLSESPDFLYPSQFRMNLF